MNNSEPTPEYIAQQCAQADWLALQARGAAVAGDNDRANQLRNEYDRLWDRLEAALGYEHL